MKERKALRGVTLLRRASSAADPTAAAAGAPAVVPVPAEDEEAAANTYENLSNKNDIEKQTKE